MNIRIQTYGTLERAGQKLPTLTNMTTVEGTTVYEALEKALDDLKDLCDVALENFQTARDEFNEKRQ